MAHTDPHGHGAAGHEVEDVNLAGANRFLVVMVVFLAAVFGFIYFVYVNWRASAVTAPSTVPAIAVRSGDRQPPLPRLQTTPYGDLKTFRDSEEQVLTSYAWVDKEKGVVRVPVSRAIELLAERGLPTPPPAPVAAPGAVPPPADGTPAPPSAPAPPPAPVQ